jgi:[acyl-carrier-protein] S-malonyltransferase
MIVIACPGQGSQKPGFLSPWLEQPGVSDTLARWSEAISLDLVTHGTVGDQDTIRDTSIAQPLIVAAGLITGRMVQNALGDGVTLSYAGHSVGEITAAALAGVLSDDDAMRLVAARGRSMAEAASREPTGMSAVIGGDQSAVSDDLRSRGLVPANVNGAGQIVAAGAKNLLADLAAEPPAGTRVIPLDVAGAFHTHYMAPALEAMRAEAQALTFSDPTAPLYSNSDGSIVDSGERVRDLLVSQVSSPVRWDLCMEGFASAGIATLIELAPSGALVGLAKRALPGVVAVKIDLPGSIDALTDLA